MSPQLWVAAGAGVVGSLLGGLRWLRVAQREHYLAGSSVRFAWRWWAGSVINRAACAVALVAVAISGFVPVACVASSAVVAAGPVGLGLRGRTSALVWTSRLRRLAGVWGLLQAVVLAGSVLLAVSVGGGAVLVGLVVLAVPLVMDLACLVTSPVERRLVAPFVAAAAARLASVRPLVVGITGSFGKTGTKGYVAHLLAGSRSVVASPASYNNRTGLARAINEALAPGTEVFVAEMGTYGPGEIASLCGWLRPAVAVITAIGPVHLERMKSEETILAAKSEILVDGAVAVLNVDDARLAALASAEVGRGRRVWRCSALDRAADVWVGSSGVLVRGERLSGPPPVGSPFTNVACAVAVALELGAPPESVSELVVSLPVAPNRLTRRVAEAGFGILDDTYNSNPAGAAMALDALAACGGPGGLRVLVTPGMVELGVRQRSENEALARRASGVVTHMVVVGRTNRRALLRGTSGRPEVILVRTREEAVTWVKGHLGVGDTVLYENDLPDHYP